MNWTVHTWWAVRGGDWETLWIRVGRGNGYAVGMGNARQRLGLEGNTSVIVAMPSIDPACKEQHYT